DIYNTIRAQYEVKIIEKELTHEVIRVKNVRL
ncbi:membrane protein, partial [Enterobacter hormaechei]